MAFGVNPSIFPAQRFNTLSVEEISQRQILLAAKVGPDMPLDQFLMVHAEDKELAKEKAKKETERDAQFAMDESLKLYAKRQWQHKQKLIQDGVLFF